MFRGHQIQKIGIFGVLIGVLVFLPPPTAGSENRAIFSLWPNLANPFMSTGPTGLTFAPLKLNLLGKGSFRSSQIPEMEPIESYGSFFGLKITVRLEGGWNTFAGGDVEKGIGGLFDNAVAVISAYDVPIMRNKRESSRAGLEAGMDLIYSLTPRFGIGIGAAKVKAGKDSHFAFQYSSEEYADDLRLWPEIKVFTFRTGLFYTFPFAGRLAISVRGGPAIYFAKYSCSIGLNAGSSIPELVDLGFTDMGYFQKGQARQIGFEGGIGFEFNPNPFVAFFVEAQGRYAKIGGFEGEEETGYYQDAFYQRSVRKGPVYFGDEDTYPCLDIIPEASGVPSRARKANLDFSGVSFFAGLKLRF